MARRPVCYLLALSLVFFAVGVTCSLKASGADVTELKPETSSFGFDGLVEDSSPSAASSDHPLVTGAGQELRRLAGRAGRARTRSKASQGVSWGHILL